MERKALLAHPVGFSFFGKEYYPLMRIDGHVFLRTNSATVGAVSVCEEVKCEGPGRVLGTLSLGLRTPLVPGLGGDKVAPAAQPEKALLLLCRSRVALGPCACALPLLPRDRLIKSRDLLGKLCSNLSSPLQFSYVLAGNRFFFGGGLDSCRRLMGYRRLVSLPGVT